MMPKVSIVITCYNKEQFLSKMLDSILVQKWDNIELIIVNDGSTDASGHILAWYESKFIARGYEINIINQKNAGVAVASKNGLAQVTGEFVCLLDADDELSPLYVSKLAGWLVANPTYDWVACDAIREEDDNKTYYVETTPTDEKMAERWLMQTFHREVWVYMVRTDYMNKCKVVERFNTKRIGNQEGQFFLPLSMGGGKIGFINEPLYKHNLLNIETHRSYSQDYNRLSTRYAGFIQSINEIIKSLDIDEDEKKRLCAISEIKHKILVVKACLYRMFGNESVENALESLFETVIKYFSTIPIMYKYNAYNNPWVFCDAIEDNILNIKSRIAEHPKGRIIGWGAMGNNGKHALPYLTNTPLSPTDLWDASIENSYIKHPDVDNITDKDTIIIFPSRVKIVEEINKLLIGKKCNIILYQDIKVYIGSILFADFYNGGIKFKPCNQK